MTRILPSIALSLVLASTAPVLAQSSTDASLSRGSFNRTGGLSIVSGGALDAAAGATSGLATSTAAHSNAAAGTVWLLCPPAGVSDTQPLLAGTDLSCAP